MAVLEPAVRALAAAAEAAEAAAPSSGGAQSAEASAMLADVSGRAVGVLLRQSVERIGRLREAALRHVRRLLADPLVRPHVPHAAAVAAAVAAAAEAAEAGGVSASLEALQRVVVQLLPVAPYTGHLLEGLAASIGGVDNSLAKVASAALLEALASAGASGVGGAEVAAADGVTGASESGSGSGSGQAAQAALVAAVCGHLLDIWSRHAKSPRMATPLLRTALLLLTKAPGAADTLLPRPPPPAPPAQAAEAGSAAPAATSTSAGGVGSSAPGGLQSRWVDHLVEAARAETRGCGDVARLVEAAAVLAHLAVVPPAAAAAAAAAGAAGGGGGGHCRSSALQGLLVLLCSRYPKVRRHAAEQLYLQLLALDTSSPHPTTASYSPTAAPASPPPPPPPLESVSDAACDLLLATAWDGDMEPAKAARDALAALVGVPVPKMKAPAASARAAAAPRDENASYQALLDDFARGY